MDYIQQMKNTGTMAFGQNRSRNSYQDTEAKAEMLELRQQIVDQKNRVDRVLKLSQEKIYSLEKEVNELRTELKKCTDVITKITDKDTVQRTRDALFSRREKAPADKPIDRTGVCPKDVQIEKLFNFSNKRF